MPRTIKTAATLEALLHAQDGVATVDQLLGHGISRNAIDKRVTRGRWQRLISGVILTEPGSRTRRQLLIAASLWAGADAAIDGVDALRWYGLDVPRPAGDRVHVVVPALSQHRTRGFVVVRRALAQITVGDHGLVPYVDAATAAIVAARNERDTRRGINLLSRSLQQGVVTVRSLQTARQLIGDKWCRPTDGALLAVGVGLRSSAEADLRRLWSTSALLPEPTWNQWLDLGDGGPFVCVDALIKSAGMAQEVIGRKYHAWGAQYEDTAARKERLQACGIVVTDATPMRIRRAGPALLANIERIYKQHAGRGMPDGVRLIKPPGIAT
ncbi:MAG TPA: type IV toxin-antitoxin system AbiEi family antitoxin domain-containing protein [Mycobacteriales bacterium]|nr:type IV toxin-antitoxin system AbiEi family antitoxin domain-containing protein [Mycobacteriales bacterium]